ncbi:MAG: class I SAM-dependent methyltransferase [Candidatus Eremiobacteraeota bacterium]|nr:class I SAM-dependent methyltransferase [Candidatus Eremiobacteraeota bacterium]
MIQTLKNLIPQMIEEWEDMQNAYYPDRKGQFGFLVSIVSQMEEVERILEIGAGTGKLSKMLMDRNPGASVTLVDFDDIMLEMAKYNLREFDKNAKFSKRDLKNSEWVEGIPKNLSAVVSTYTFHVLPDKRRPEVYSEIYSMLKKGGLFICVDEVDSNFQGFNTICQKALEKVRDNERVRELSGDWKDFWSRVGKRMGKENYAADMLQHTYPDGTTNLGTLDSQFKMLKEAGFDKVECFYRDLSIVMYGGMKE